MSKILIENYRGWDIYFDNDKENFYTASDTWDRQNTKTSFAATKKYIDDFIKDNLVFEPIVVEKEEYGTPKQIKLIGVRKDGRFVYEGESGRKEQLSEYDERYYYLPSDENNILFSKIKEQKVIEEKARKERERLIALITKQPILAELKEKYKELIDK